MKLLFAVFVSALALSAQDPQAAPPAKKTAAKAAPKALASPKVKNASKPLPIPAEAVLGADGYYRYTDTQGKKWLYRKTPFGVTRMEDSPQVTATKAADSTGAGIHATEAGDLVRFERPGPFGLWKWEKKKSEMDDGEKAALARSQSGASTTASKQD